VDFQGSSRPHRTPQRCRALLTINPYLRTSRFQGGRSLRRKDNSSRGPYRRLHRGLRCREYLYRGAGILTGFPFGERTKVRNRAELPSALGPADSRPIAVHAKPFPTSVLKVLILVFATITKICTRGCSTRGHPLSFDTTSTPAYSLESRSNPAAKYR